MNDKNSLTEISHTETLDPENWDEVRSMGHQMLDDMLDHMAGVRDRPVWRSVTKDSAHALDESLPLKGAPLDEVYEQFQHHILPYPTGNAHPRFFGWVMGNGTATGMLADMLASGMNAHVAGYDQSAALVERQVIKWLAAIMGFPDDATGLLVSGGTMANLNGLCVARNQKAGFDIREEGLQVSKTPRLRVYGSAQTHGWIYKACELMGLGRSAFHVVPMDQHYQIDVAQCRDAIKRDIARGEKPFCIIGTVGTVNTGAIDDIAGLRSLADEFDLWLHVDGAFGSLAAMSPSAHPLVEAQAKADSIAFDLHKWGYMPYEVGCILVRAAKAQSATFAMTAPYLSSSNRGISVETTYFADLGLQLSRGFRALKVWMSLKEQGISKIGRVIQQNIEQAAYLKDLVEAQANLELLAPVSLNIVCLRYVEAGFDEAALNILNEEILLRIQESGLAVPSHTILSGKFAIRICITNHRSQDRDFDMVVDAVVSHAREIIAHKPD